MSTSNTTEGTIEARKSTLEVQVTNSPANRPVTVTDREQRELKPKNVTVNADATVMTSMADVIGYLKIATPIITKYSDRLKGVMLDQKAKNVKGVISEGYVRQSKPGSKVDAGMFVKACKRNKVPESKMVEALTVSKDAAQALLNGVDMARCLIPTPPPSPSVVIEPIKGISLPSAPEALRRLADLIESFEAEDAQAAATAPAGPAQGESAE